jgi:hypothetical protein
MNTNLTNKLVGNQGFTYALLQLQKKNKRDIVCVSDNINQLNNALDKKIIEYYGNFDRNKSRAMQLFIFKYDEVNIDMDDMEKIKLSFPCVLIKCKKMRINIKGNCVLACATVNKNPHINSIISMRRLEKRLGKMNKKELDKFSIEKQYYINFPWYYTKKKIKEKMLYKELKKILDL